MSKKIISLLLVLVMVLSMAACGSGNADTTTAGNSDTTADAADTTAATEKKDPVTINYWYQNGGGVGEAQQKVEDELNRILSETPGYEYITVKLHPCASPSTDITLAMSEDPKSVDVLSTVGYGDAEKIKEGEFLALDEIVAANPEITADLPDFFVDYGKWDGKLYMIPNYQQICNTGFMYTAKDYLDKAGYTEEEFRSIIIERDFDKRVKLFEDLCDAGRELGYKNVYIPVNMINDYRGWTGFSNMVLNLTWHCSLNWNADEKCAELSQEMDWIYRGYEQAAKWYSNGYGYQDASTDEEFIDNGNLFHSDLNGNWCVQMKEGYGTAEMASAQLTEQFGYEIVAAELVDDMLYPADNAAGGVAVCAATEHPEEAGKFLALLFNKKYEQFYNTLVYGLEGEQYKKLTDTTVETLEYSGSQTNVPASSYSYWKWCGGNTFNAWNNQSLAEESEEFIVNNINNNPNANTELVGFRFDKTDVMTAIEQCTAVTTEYWEALRYGEKGADGWKAYYDEYMGKLETAGIRDILDAYNTQVSEYLAK